MGQCDKCIQRLVMSNCYCTNGQWIKKNTRHSQSLPQRKNTRILLECKDGSRYFNTQKFTYPPPGGKNNNKKNCDIVETRKKLALYENIKFYDYIP